MTYRSGKCSDMLVKTNIQAQSPPTRTTYILDTVFCFSRMSTTIVFRRGKVFEHAPDMNKNNNK